MINSRRFLWIVAFVSGMCVMALEMSASRLVAPYFGTSLFVWANVIGMMMAALAAGYWIGGRLAERRPDPRVLYKLLLLAAVWAALIPFLAAPLSRFVVLELLVVSGAGIIIVGSFMTLLVLFAVPIFLMGMTSPFLIKLLSQERGAGEVAGGVFALSTIGSLIGTFLPVLGLIPLIGTRATVLSFAALLFVVVLVGLIGARRGSAGLVLFLLIPIAAGMPIHRADGQLAETESPYQYIQIIEHDGVRLLRFNEALADQSAERLDTPLTGRYWDTVLPLPLLTQAEQPRVLILGLAAGTIARGMIDTGVVAAGDVTGVEIDSAVVDMGEQFFSLRRLQDQGLRVEVEDARTFLERTTEQFDLILVDAYANQLYIPPHLATQEFFTLAKARLADGGVLVANVNAPNDASQLLRSLGTTIESVFPVVERYRVPDSWNTVFLAGRSPLDWDAADNRQPDMLRDTFAGVREARQTVRLEPGLLLTDDRAPVELMTDAMLFEAFRQ